MKHTALLLMFRGSNRNISTSKAILFKGTQIMLAITSEILHSCYLARSNLIAEASHVRRGMPMHGLHCLELRSSKKVTSMIGV